MSLQRYLIIMAGATFFCWIAWIIVLWRTNPFSAGWVSFFVFYASLFLALWGTLALCGLFIKIKIQHQDDPHFRQVKKTFRQGLLITILFLIALILQSQRILTWWNTIILVLAFTFFELFLITGNKQA